MKKTEMLAQMKKISLALEAIKAQLPLDDFDTIVSDLDYLRDEVSETQENIPESFAYRRDKWGEYHDEIDEITNDLESLKEQIEELASIAERVEDFILNHQ